jgi:hypothetical protein
LDGFFSKCMLPAEHHKTGKGQAGAIKAANTAPAKNAAANLAPTNAPVSAPPAGLAM